MSSTGMHTAVWSGVLEGRPGPSPTKRKPAIKGGEIVNKDFVEASYQIHRDYVLDRIGPLVDAHLDIPDICRDPSYKNFLIERKQIKLAKSNDLMYKHVKVVDDRPSYIRDYKDKNSSKIASSLELNTRIRTYDASAWARDIEKSNQSMLKRMESTKPDKSLSIQATSSWYEEQKKVAESKRTCRADPCAGHLGLNGTRKGILPPPLTPITDTNSPYMSRTLSATGVSGYFHDTPYSPQRNSQTIRSPKNRTSPFKLSPKNNSSPVGAIRPHTAPEIRTSSALFFDVNNAIPFDNNLPLDSILSFDEDSPYGSNSDIMEQHASREDAGFNNTPFQDIVLPTVGGRAKIGAKSASKAVRPSTVHAKGTGTMSGGGGGKRAVTAGAGTGRRAIGSRSGDAGAGVLLGSRTLSSSGGRIAGSLDGSSSSPTPINLDSLYLWDPFLAPGNVTFDSLRQSIVSSRTASGGVKSRKNSSTVMSPGKGTLGSSQKGSYRRPSLISQSRNNSGKDSDSHMAKAIKDAEDLAQKALAVITAAQLAKDAETGGGKGGGRLNDIRGSRTSMSRTSLRASFVRSDTVKKNLRPVELLTRRLIIFSKDGEDLSDHKPSIWATGEEESNDEDVIIFNSSFDVGEEGRDEDQGGQETTKGSSRVNLLTKLTREASMVSLESIFAKALEDGDDADEEEKEGKEGDGNLDTSQRAKERRKHDPTNQFMWLQIVYYPDDCESVTMRLVPADLSMAFSTAPKDEPLDEYGLPIVPASPPIMFIERVLKIEDAKWMIPHSIFDLDHVDPLQLVAEYSNDQTMSVDLIATRMAIIGIFRKSDTDGGGTLSSEEFQYNLLDFDARFGALVRKLSHADISALVADLDADDGVISYDEYRKFAVVMMQAFRARNYGKSRADADYLSLKSEIEVTMKNQRIEEISVTCMYMFRACDVNKTGVLRYSDFYNILIQASAQHSVSFTDVEVIEIRKGMNRDSFGRVSYEKFPQLLFLARFNTLKKVHIEMNSTNPALRAVLAECKRLEKENYVPTSLAAMDKKNFIASGFIEMRLFATLLSKTEHLNLSYMQAAILISGGEIDESGVIDYFDLLPLVVHGNALLTTPENKAQLKEMMRITDLHCDMSEVVRVYTHEELTQLAALVSDAAVIRAQTNPSAQLSTGRPAVDVQTLTVSFGEDLTSHRSWVADGSEKGYGSSKSGGSRKEEDYNDDEYDQDDYHESNGERSGRDGASDKTHMAVASGEEDDNDYGEDDYDGDLEFIDEPDGAAAQQQGLAPGLELDFEPQPSQGQIAAFTLSDKTKETDASMLSAMSLKIELELQQAATRLSYDSRMNQENEVKATARGLAQKLAQGLEGLAKGLEGLALLQEEAPTEPEPAPAPAVEPEQLAVSTVGSIPPLDTSNTIAAATHITTNAAQSSSSTARSSITVHSHRAPHAGSHELLLFDLVLPGDGAVVLATRGNVAIPVPPENPSLLPNPDLSEYRSPMSTGIFDEAGKHAKVDTEADTGENTPISSPMSSSRKAVSRKTVTYQGDDDGETLDEEEEEKEKEESKMGAGGGSGKDDDSDEEEEEEEEEEGLQCELFAIASTYSPDSITIRAISGSDDNPLLPKRIVAERLVPIKAAEALYKQWSASSMQPSATSTRSQSPSESIIHTPLADGTPVGTPRGQSGSFSLGIGSSSVSNAPNPGLDTEQTLVQKLHESLSVQENPMSEQPPPHSRPDEVPTTKHSSMKPESSTTVRTNRNITFDSFPSQQDHSPAAITEVDTETPMILPDLPKLAKTMLYVVDLKLVGDENTLTITLPGDNMSRTASMRLLRNSSVGSPYKSLNRYRISETPGFNREGTFLLLKAAMMLKIIVVSPPSIKGRGVGSMGHSHGSAQLVQQKSTKGLLPMPSGNNLPIYTTTNQSSNQQQQAQLATYTKMFSPLIRTLAWKIAMPTMVGGTAIAELQPQGVLISVHAIQVAEGNGRGGYHTMLVANITSPSALIAVTKVLIPVKLPSAMLLDTELAEEFVETLVPNLTMEVPYDWNGLTHKGVRMIINPMQQL